MGDRGHIVIEQYGETAAPVVLYTHWYATELPQIVADALSHEKRWSDHEYLARIIFDELSARSSDFTGCGIGTQKHGDTWRTIVVDPNNQTVSFTDPNGFKSCPHRGLTFEFNEFVDEFLEVATI